jgi:regulation of enolase protein 1 (concanavalin A-like superfamily)
MEKRSLTEGSWLNPPLEAKLNDEGLLITAKENSDFWQKTSYGFVHHSGHALLNDFKNESAVEAT